MSCFSYYPQMTPIFADNFAWYDKISASICVICGRWLRRLCCSENKVESRLSLGKKRVETIAFLRINSSLDFISLPLLFFFYDSPID